MVELPFTPGKPATIMHAQYQAFHGVQLPTCGTNFQPQFTKDMGKSSGKGQGKKDAGFGSGNGYATRDPRSQHAISDRNAADSKVKIAGPGHTADIHDISTDASTEAHISDHDADGAHASILHGKSSQQQQRGQTNRRQMQAQPRNRHGADAEQADSVLDAEARAAMRALLDGNIELADRMLSERSTKISKVVYHSMIHYCGKIGNLQAAVWCASRMRNSGLKPNIVTFNSLVTACAKVGDLKLGVEWFDLMVQSGLKPNRITYNIMINASVKARDVAAGEHWMQRMLEDGFEPCTLTYGSIINGFGMAGDIKKAELWFSKMIAAGVKPDRVLYNSLLNACAKSKNPQKAEYWLQQMRADNIATDEKSYNSIIHAYAKKGLWDRAEYWLQRMKEQGCRADEVTYGSVIHACAKAANKDRAEHWINVMHQEGINSNLVCNNLLLHACAQSKDADSATAWFDKMKDKGMPLNAITFNCMIDAHSKNRDIASAKSCLKEMLDADCHPDKVTLATFMQCFAGNAGESEAMCNWFFATVTSKYLATGNMEQINYWIPEIASAEAAAASRMECFAPQPEAASFMRTSGKQLQPEPRQRTTHAAWDMSTSHVSRSGLTCGNQVMVFSF